MLNANWEPNRVVTLQAAHKRARLVARLRRVFVIGASASFASVFAFVAFNTMDDGYAMEIPREPLQMVSPRFLGHSDSTGPFQISADAAQHRDGDAQTIDLASPVYRSEAGGFMAAPRGRYDEESNTILFEGDVVMANRGMRLSARSAVVDLENGRVTARGGVRGSAPARQP